MGNHLERPPRARNHRFHLSSRPRGMPSDDGGDAYRQWFATQMLATLQQDVEEITQLERLDHHLVSFLAQVRSWRS